jgi:hypothetical protein
MDKNWRKSWTKYSIGLLVVWAIVLTITLVFNGTVHPTALFVVSGVLIGWLSATIKITLMSKGKF